MKTPDLIFRISQYLWKAFQRQTADIENVFSPMMPDKPSIPSDHFHTAPELFLQVAGYTDFTLPWTHFRLNPSQICIMPAYAPHAERHCRLQNRFDFIVGCFSAGGIDWHEATLNEKDKLTGTPQIFCRIHQISRLTQLCEQNTLAASCSSRYAKSQRKGASILFLSALLDAMENADMLSPTEHPKVSICKQLIRDHLGEPVLCVKYLARMTECSPNYLSMLFYRETHTYLSDYITDHRLERVVGLLKHSTLNIEEIAHVSGYDDPGYMTRVFVKKFGMTPRDYRRRIERT
jgi:AraC-like DNA-binding protein